MRVTLLFDSGGASTVDLVAETEAEKSILAFLSEGPKRWRTSHSYTYRPGAIPKIQLIEERETDIPAGMEVR